MLVAVEQLGDHGPVDLLARSCDHRSRQMVLYSLPLTSSRVAVAREVDDEERYTGDHSNGTELRYRPIVVQVDVLNLEGFAELT